ncbi:MAG: DUF1328 domain-containing protein [Chloroflexi bacterium]|nr:DUF1328 domain-containing protein [Chloroflexota bacterium]
MIFWLAVALGAVALVVLLLGAWRVASCTLRIAKILFVLLLVIAVVLLVVYFVRRAA